MRKLSKLLLLIALHFTIQVSGQNLVPDSSFSIRVSRPENVGYLTDLKFWSSAVDYDRITTEDLGSPDLLNTECIRENNGLIVFGTPENGYGYQRPITGNSYVGILPFTVMGRFREYIQTPLKSPLIKKQLYCIKMYVSLADSSNFESDALDVCLSKKPISSSNYFIDHKIKDKYIVYNHQIITNKKDWVCMSYLYTANGKEQYLTIGNFKKSNNVTNHNQIYTSLDDEFDVFKSYKKDYMGSYYFVENVSVVAINDASGCACQDIIQPEKPVKAVTDTTEPIKEDIFKNVNAGTTIVLNNIFFETDKWDLVPVSFAELNTIYNYMVENAKVEIEISGHTDNSGSNEYNLSLSENRAKAVVEYLIGKGIAQTRLSYKGYGSTKPVADNETKEGKAQNRRVELTIKKR